MITTAIQTRNFRMMLTRTSRSSKATSWCTGKPPGPLLRCSVLMLRNGLRKFRIAQGQQRLLLQVHGEETNPQADKGDGYDNVQPGGNALEVNSGRVYQKRSTSRMIIIHRAT